ncbi:MAG: hypothetical protein JSU63_14995 [Phycisphaerales bacterium]|nr:MAG: hypothetical protein JSU63_14995 [Phycisphaerales bacterium]
MKAMPLWLRATCLVAVLFTVTANAQVIEWVPVDASGNHTIIGNEIVLEGGGQLVTLHLKLSGWDPDQIGETLGSYQAAIDPSDYLGANASPANPGVDLNPSGWPISPSDGIFQALQVCVETLQFPDVFDPLSTCTSATAEEDCGPFPAGCVDRPDFVYAGVDFVPTVTTSTLAYTMGAATVDCPTDPDGGMTKFYGGTLILEVPVDAQGSYTVGFNNSPDYTLMTNCIGIFMSTMTRVPAQISIACGSNEDCDDGNDCTENICDAGICTYPPEPAGLSCGNPPAGPCDAQDTCDGAGVCQPNYAPAGTTCGSPFDTDCDDPDTCDGAGNCDPNTEPDGTACPDDGLACTIDECSGGECAHPAQPVGTPCGDPSDTECDNPDTCDASGACRDNLESAGTSCGDPTSTECDGADACDGNGTCAQNIQPVGTTCGDQTESDCDHPDSCDGAGSCQTNLEPSGYPCGNPVGNQCDDPDTCDGVGTCQLNSLPAGTACGDPSTSECDNRDECDGAGVCDANNIPNGTPCTDDGNECREDVCQSGICSHPLSPTGTPCGDPTSTECNAPDTCDGSGTCSPNLEPSGAACGDPTATDCDRADSCDGSGSCLENIEPAGIACGDPSDTDCDNPDTCDGAGTCAANVAPPGLPCGNQVGNQCDNPDTCDGSGTCEPNFVSSGTPCGNPSSSECDDPNTCDGGGICDANNLPNDTGCTDDGNECRDDVCLSGVCSHPLKTAGSACGDPTDTDCNGADSCDGTGTCLPNLEPAGTLCGNPDDTICTDPDTCNGFGTCIPNHATDGTECDEGSFCNQGAVCVGGECTGGSVIDCDDGLVCTEDTCNESLQQCDHDLLPDYCLIDDVCYDVDEFNPENDCQYCDPSLTATDWTFMPEGTACDDGDPCTGTGEPGVGFDACNTVGECIGTIDPACNDDCINAVQVYDGANIGNNSDRGIDDDEASCQLDSNNDVWFYYLATCTGPVMMDTVGSIFLPFNDTVLSVYAQCGGVEVACDDDGGPDLLSVLAFSAVDGEIYYIRVAGFADNSGDIVLNIATLDGCVIDDICYSNGQVNPDNECEACIPLLSSMDWSSRAAGSPCGDPTETECDSPDACDGGGECEANYKTDFELCTDDGNDCTDDICHAGACTHPPKSVGTACGDQAVTECDNPDTCDGAGACMPNYAPLGLSCGDLSTSDCDNADICDGQGLCDPNYQPNGAACTDDGIECTFDQCGDGICLHPPRDTGTPCGDGSNTQCDNPDTCDGTGICLDNYEPGGTTCGDSTDTDCNNPDTCNGTGTCVTNYEPVGTGCGDPTDTDCDNPDTCDGAGGCLDNLEITGVPCGDPANTQCDNPDTCDGTGICLDNYEPSGVTCGDPSSSDCDNADTCDGGGLCDPNHQPDGLVCTDDGNACTYDECASGECLHPPRIAGTPCGDGTNTQCDNPDTCDGTGICLDNYEPGGTTCGDLADTDCDNPDACDGGGQCQDNYELSGFGCGDATDNDCNNSDTCDGTGTCLDNYEVTGFPCGDAGNTQCDNPDTCDGVGICLPNHEPAGLECGNQSTSECDEADSCDGDGECAPNHVGTGTPCTDDGNQCTGDICDLGDCTHPYEPTGTPCNDDDVCTTTDECDKGVCAGTLIAEQLITLQEGPKAISFVTQPVLSAPDVALLVTSPDWPCLSKYVGSMRCGGDGIRCEFDAECNACSYSHGPCLSDADCDYGRCDNGWECSIAAQDCADMSVCVRIDFCNISGDLCEPASLALVDVNDDGLMDGWGATLVDNPAHAAVMSLANWTAGVMRCSKSALPCSVDGQCERGICDNGSPCIVSAQACADLSTCVLDEACLPGRVFLSGRDIVPSTQYDVQAECGALLSEPGAANTCLWADVNCNGYVNVTDVQLVKLGNEGTFQYATFGQLDIDPCAPQGIINITDLQRVILAIEGQTYEDMGCRVPCP